MSCAPSVDPDGDGSPGRTQPIPGCFVAGPPPSHTFMDFVVRWLDCGDYGVQLWSDQISESLASSHRDLRPAETCLQRILDCPQGVAAVNRAHDWFRKLSSNTRGTLAELHRHFEFLAIIGMPRTGGSYLTAEAFSALGHDPRSVPAAIAHDGFPDVRPGVLSRRGNEWNNALMKMSEYLAMIEIYFGNAAAGERRSIPKKVLKGIPAAGLFKAVFGRHSRYLVTVRSPIACCISAYEKSGGLPGNGLFQCRSLIEHLVVRDLAATGVDKETALQREYFSIYVRYWEQFYINLAMSGLLAGSRYRVVPYGAAAMEAIAAKLHRQYGSKREPGRFICSARLDLRHPEWIKRSLRAMERVAAVWELVGLEFPVAELSECR
jgi:hypothetical protein